MTTRKQCLLDTAWGKSGGRDEYDQDTLYELLKELI